MKNTTLKLARSKKVDRRETKEAQKEIAALEDDSLPSLRFIDAEHGEMTLFFNGSLGLCYKEPGSEEIKIYTRTQPQLIAEFGDPAKMLMVLVTLGLDLLSGTSGRDLALHMLKTQIDLLAEKVPLKDKVARKTLRKYKMQLEGLN